MEMRRNTEGGYINLHNFFGVTYAFTNYDIKQNARNPQPLQKINGR